MLSALFSFSGRMNRLQYLGWTIAAVAVTTIPGLILSLIVFMSLASSMRGMTPDQMIHSSQFVFCIGAAVLVVVWPALALMVKRLRDIGVPPLVCILAYIGFVLFDRFVISHFLHTKPGGATIVGGIVEFVFWLFVMLMPGGTDEGGQPDLSYLAPEIDRMRRQMRADHDTPASHPPQPTIRKPVPQATAPQTFGRRR